MWQPFDWLPPLVATFVMKVATSTLAEIGARMKAARDALGLSRPAFATKCGCTVRTLENNEGGANEAKAGLIEAFVRLGINANWLLTGDGPMRLSGLQERAGTPAPAALDVAALKTVMKLLDEELARKHARLDPDRKAEVVALLYEEAVAESEEEPRRGRVLHLLRLVA